VGTSYQSNTDVSAFVYSGGLTINGRFDMGFAIGNLRDEPSHRTIQSVSLGFYPTKQDASASSVSIGLQTAFQWTSNTPGVIASVGVCFFKMTTISRRLSLLPTGGAFHMRNLDNLKQHNTAVVFGLPVVLKPSTWVLLTFNPTITIDEDYETYTIGIGIVFMAPTETANKKTEHNTLEVRRYPSMAKASGR